MTDEEMLKAAAQAEQLNDTAKALDRISRAVPALLVARGVELRKLTHAQAMAGLEAAEEALRFIAKMGIAIERADGAKEIQIEPVSQWEARAGLAKVLKAIEDAQ